MEIKIYPDEVLFKKAKPVDVQNELLKVKYNALIKEMEKIMEANNGLGLAAPQVGISERFFIIRSPEDGKLYTFFNPELKLIGEEIVFEEGCLSLPGLIRTIVRNDKVVVYYFDEDFKRKKMVATDIMAVALQHENDHLDGVLFIDHLPDNEKQEAIEEFYKINKKTK